jgi:hypothetical protein
MGRSIMLGIGLALGLVLLLAGCGGRAAPVIPTVAQLPTVTPTEEIFFTPTPAELTPVEVTAAPGEAPEGSRATEEAGGSDVGGPSTTLPSPTPETMAEGEPTGGPCSTADLDTVLAAVDLAALRADLDTFAARLRDAAAVIGDWSLSTEPDPLAGEGTGLPLASLRYNRSSGQQAVILVTRATGMLREHYDACLPVEAFFREGDVSAEATVTIETLGIGDRGVLATIVEPVDPELSSTGITALSTQVYAVLIGDTLIRYVNIPALAEVMGQPPVSRSDALLLLSGLVSAVRGL